MTTNEQIRNVLLDHVNTIEAGGDNAASAAKSFNQMLAVRQGLVEPTGPDRRNRALNNRQAQAMSDALNLSRSPATTRSQIERFLEVHGELDWAALL